ncbi:protein misato [Drosophila grimshawi]|uniref:GH24680 n=1 Tax=Drosophila grimshawi TaxID=7222 RepID=B4JMR8_DROGR|nr:protein misato [Drosophila grimshawi]EDV92011.1 GH24680 [Drosophila grimshawi]
MDHTREILTFQFGTYANYVGAHFWNQQEANFVYDGESSNVAEEHLPHNDILYREGVNDRKQATFTPRLLSVDLVGTLMHLPVVGELYGNYLPLATDQTADELQKAKELAEQNKLSTHGELDVRQQPAATISEYQQDLLKNTVNTQDKDYNLAETCSSWADFLYARYHPRTFNVLQGMLQQPDVQVLGSHCSGVELWQSAAFNEDFCDRIRLYAEECNGLQGFQLLFDIDDGFGGLASKCMEHLNDEYNRAIFALPLHYPRNMSYAKADTRTSRSIRVVNSVLSYKHLSEQANLFTPLSTLETIWRNQTLESRRMPGVNWLADNLYQSSAVLAAYLDTVTLGYRLRQTPNTLLSFCERVTPANRKLGAAALALPLGMQREQDLIDFLDGPDGSLMTQLTPGCDPGTTHVVQSVVARGIPDARLKRPLEQAGSQISKAAYRCNSVSQMLQLYYQCAYHSSLTHAASTPLPLKTHLPFPYEIFDASIAADGFKLPGDGQRERDTRVASAPALAAVQNSSKLGTHLDSLHDQTHRVQLAKLRNFSQVALERDEYDSALDRILEFRDNYEDSHYL